MRILVRWLIALGLCSSLAPLPAQGSSEQVAGMIEFAQEALGNGEKDLAVVTLRRAVAALGGLQKGVVNDAYRSAAEGLLAEADPGHGDYARNCREAAGQLREAVRFYLRLERTSLAGQLAAIVMRLDPEQDPGEMSELAVEAGSQRPAWPDAVPVSERTGLAGSLHRIAGAEQLLAEADDSKGAERRRLRGDAMDLLRDGIPLGYHESKATTARLVCRWCSELMDQAEPPRTKGRKVMRAAAEALVRQGALDQEHGLTRCAGMLIGLATVMEPEIGAPALYALPSGAFPAPPDRAAIPLPDPVIPEVARGAGAEQLKDAESAHAERNPDATIVAALAARGALQSGGRDAVRETLLKAADALAGDLDPHWQKRCEALQRVAYRLDRLADAYRAAGMEALAGDLVFRAATVRRLLGADLVVQKIPMSVVVGSLLVAMAPTDAVAADRVPDAETRLRHWWRARLALTAVSSQRVREGTAGEIRTGLERAPDYPASDLVGLREAATDLVRILDGDIDKGLARTAHWMAYVAAVADPVAGGAAMQRVRAAFPETDPVAPAAESAATTTDLLRKAFSGRRATWGEPFTWEGEGLRNPAGGHLCMMMSNLRPEQGQGVAIKVRSITRNGDQYAGLWFGSPGAAGSFWAGAKIVAGGALFAVAYTPSEAGSRMVEALHTQVAAQVPEGPIEIALRMRGGKLEIRVADDKWRALQGGAPLFPAVIGLYVCGANPDGPSGVVEFTGLRVE